MTNQEYWLRTARVLVLVLVVAACSSDASTSSTTPAPDLVNGIYKKSSTRAL